jgi:hypothetical protein
MGGETGKLYPIYAISPSATFLLTHIYRVNRAVPVLRERNNKLNFNFILLEKSFWITMNVFPSALQRKFRLGIHICISVPGCLYQRI